MQMIEKESPEVTAENLKVVAVAIGEMYRNYQEAQKSLAAAENRVCDDFRKLDTLRAEFGRLLGTCSVPVLEEFDTLMGYPFSGIFDAFSIEIRKPREPAQSAQ